MVSRCEEHKLTSEAIFNVVQARPPGLIYTEEIVMLTTVRTTWQPTYFYIQNFHQQCTGICTTALNKADYHIIHPCVICMVAMSMKKQGVAAVVVQMILQTCQCTCSLFSDSSDKLLACSPSSMSSPYTGLRMPWHLQWVWENVYQAVAPGLQGPHVVLSTGQKYWNQLN